MAEEKVIPYSYDQKDEMYNIRMSPDGFKVVKELITEGAKYISPGTDIVFIERNSSPSSKSQN